MKHSNTKNISDHDDCTNNTMLLCPSIIMKQTTPCYDKSLMSAFFSDRYEMDIIEDPSAPIVILHFNDVYNINVMYADNGGISCFYTALSQYFKRNPLIFFSGDVFSPSIISRTTKGRHMVHFMNMLKIHTACIGNHDLDFGIEQFELLSGSTSFPWVLSNIFDARNPGVPIGNALPYRVCEWQGHRLGIFGLGEREWLESLGLVKEEEYIYEDFVQVAQRLCRLLRQKKCSLIIALTHMRIHNDKRLVEQVSDIDIVLGGHDHDYYGVKRIGIGIFTSVYFLLNGDTFLVKSGTDFRHFTCLEIFPKVKKSPLYDKMGEDFATLPLSELIRENFSQGAYLLPRFCQGSLLHWKCVHVSSNQFLSNVPLEKLVDKYTSSILVDYNKCIALNECYLDTKYQTVRSQETNTGCWVSDLLKICLETDLAVINSGTFRSDCIFQPGPFLVSHLLKMLPMSEPLVTLEVTGEQLKKAMEISLARLPYKEGCFLQTSGLRVVFNSDLPPYQRVVTMHVEQIQPDGTSVFHALNPTKVYTVATKEYLKIGKDGYHVFKQCSVPKDSKSYSNLFNLVHDFLSFQPHHPKPFLEDGTLPKSLAQISICKLLKMCGVLFSDTLPKIQVTTRHNIINNGSQISNDQSLEMS